MGCGYVAPSALKENNGDIPWGVAPGFCISRRWRWVE